MKAGWKEKSVGEVLRLEYGKPLNDSDRKLDGLYPVYGANGEKTRSNKFYFDKPSIIVGRKGSAGELNFDACFPDSVIGVSRGAAFGASIPLPWDVSRGTASTKSACRPVSRVNWSSTRRRMKCGPGPLPHGMPGVIALPPSRLRTGAVISRAATTRTSLLNGFWRRLRMVKAASC